VATGGTDSAATLAEEPRLCLSEASYQVLTQGAPQADRQAQPDSPRTESIATSAGYNMGARHTVGPPFFRSRACALPGVTPDELLALAESRTVKAYNTAGLLREEHSFCPDHASLFFSIQLMLGLCCALCCHVCAAALQTVEDFRRLKRHHLVFSDHACLCLVPHASLPCACINADTRSL